MPFGMKKLEWCGYLTLKKTSKISLFVDRMYERDRRTDAQTLHDDIGRAYA